MGGELRGEKRGAGWELWKRRKIGFLVILGIGITVRTQCAVDGGREGRAGQERAEGSAGENLCEREREGGSESRGKAEV